jgi:hypothetical protein
MHKPLSEEQELLNELKKQERYWRITRWILLVVIIAEFFRSIKASQDSSLLIPLLLGLVISRWHGDPKSKLIIKLYEEKLEREFIEEEIEKSRKKTVQEKKIEGFLEKLPQQPK